MARTRAQGLPTLWLSQILTHINIQMNYSKSLKGFQMSLSCAVCGNIWARSSGLMEAWSANIASGLIFSCCDLKDRDNCGSVDHLGTLLGVYSESAASQELACPLSTDFGFALLLVSILFDLSLLSSMFLIVKLLDGAKLSLTCFVKLNLVFIDKDKVLIAH